MENNTENEWHFLPEMPYECQEVLIAIKDEDEPVQAFWNGDDWGGSGLVLHYMADGYVSDPNFTHIQDMIYAWMELPKVPPFPETKD